MAALSASQNSPSEVAPSPIVTTETSSLARPEVAERNGLDSGRARKRPASAAPTPGRHSEPVGEEVVKTWRRREPQWEGICRPAEASPAFAPVAERSISSGVTPRPRQRALSR